MISALLRLEDPEAVRIIAEADLDSVQALRAMNGLARLGPAVTTPLLALLDGENLEHRTKAAEALEWCADRSCFDALLKALRSGHLGYRLSGANDRVKVNKQRLRRAAARTLGSLRDHRAVPALIEALNEKYDHDVGQLHKAAAAALGWIGGAEAEDALIRALRSPEYRVRQAVVRALAAANVRRAADTIDDLIKDLSSGKPKDPIDRVTDLSDLLSDMRTAVAILRGKPAALPSDEPDLDDLLAQLATDGLVTGLPEMHETGYIYFTQRFVDEMAQREQERKSLGT